MVCSLYIADFSGGMLWMYGAVVGRVLGMPELCLDLLGTLLLLLDGEEDKGEREEGDGGEGKKRKKRDGKEKGKVWWMIITLMIQLY